jgi:CubicO group peptidase (beta-lactamase class C family)
MAHRLLWIALAFALAPAAVAAQTPAPPAAPAPPSPAPFTPAKARAIDAIARGELHAGTTPGLAVGVVEDGLLVYARGFGFSDLSKHVRVTPQAEFYTGSLAKQFTAASILMLAQDRQLSLTDKVTRFVPELSIAHNITLAQLLQQTSGLPDYTAAPGIPHDPTKPVNLDQLIKAVNRMKPAFAPGAQVQYNNFNYTIAALIVQRVSGVPLSVYMQSHIFEPLIMTSTFLAGDQGISKTVARGYTRVGGRFESVRPWDPSWLFGSGDLVTSVDDLAKWDIGLPLLLNVDSVRQMWSASGAPGGLQYGMGWVIDQRGGQPYVWHNGELAGYHAMNAMLPGEHVAVIVLSNADSLHSQTTVSPERVANRILDVIAPLPPAQFQNVIMQRAGEWLTRLQRDQIDRTQLTPAFSQYLSDDVVIRAGLKSLGPVVSMVPIESFRRGEDTVYVFGVKFRHGSLRYQFSLAPDGKIDGLLLQP